jgi:hypothetical protein
MTFDTPGVSIVIQERVQAASIIFAKAEISKKINGKIEKQRAKPQTNTGLRPSYPIYLLLRSQA